MVETEERVEERAVPEEVEEVKAEERFEEAAAPEEKAEEVKLEAEEPLLDEKEPEEKIGEEPKVVSEEIVEEGSLQPNQITIPHFLVDAVAHTPYGAVPTALNHRYEIDASHIDIYQDAAKTQEGFDWYLEEYILGCSNHEEFVEKVGLPPSWVKKSLKRKTKEETK